jgi:hypothetical protein
MSRAGFAVTTNAEGRLFNAVGNSMASEGTRQDNEEDPLERTELARRLRRMEWPPAPPEVKERVLQRIVARNGDPQDGDGDGQSPPQASDGLN